MLPDGAVVDNAEGLGRRQGEGHVLVAPPMRAVVSRRRNDIPIYRQLMELDYNSPSA